MGLVCRIVLLALFLVSLGGCASDGERTNPTASVPIQRGDRVYAMIVNPDGSYYPLQQKGSRIIVHASVNGSMPAPFIVDTGAPQTHILTNVLAGQWQGTPQTTFFPLVGGPVQGYSSYVNTLSIGGATVTNLPVMLVNLPVLAQEGVAGLIGDDVLSQFKVTIDYQARTMTLSR